MMYPRQAMYRSQGFTLVELGITLAVVGILLSMAVPAYVRTVAENRAFAFVEALKVDVQWARTQAMAHNTYTTINFTDNNCSTWTVSVNGNVLEGRGMSNAELAKNYPGVSCSFTGSTPTFNGEGMWVAKSMGTNLNVLTQVCLQSGASRCAPSPSFGFSGFSSGANDFVVTIAATGTDRKWQMGVGGTGDLRLVAQ